MVRFSHTLSRISFLTKESRIPAIKDRDLSFVRNLRSGSVQEHVTRISVVPVQDSAIEVSIDVKHRLTQPNMAINDKSYNGLEDVPLYDSEIDQKA
jgi:hypothetical protein